MFRYVVLPFAFLVPGVLIGSIIAAQVRGQTPLAPTPIEQFQSATATATAVPAIPTATPAASPPPAITPAPADAAPPSPPAQSSAYPPNRLIIPSLGIDSPWLALGWLPNGVTMDSPPGPQDLGWYTFTAQPGSAGNAVFAGHVDWHTGAAALFAHLDSLGTGAEVDVSRADGTLVRYTVASATWYDLYHTPAAPIIAPTTVPTVTLITCGGDFDQSTHEYDQRLVIRAVAAPF